jgi:hypothetical protein
MAITPAVLDINTRQRRRVCYQTRLFVIGVQFCVVCALSSSSFSMLVPVLLCDCSSARSSATGAVAITRYSDTGGSLISSDKLLCISDSQLWTVANAAFPTNCTGGIMYQQYSGPSKESPRCCIGMQFSCNGDLL